jgi:hypothetical protein
MRTKTLLVAVAFVTATALAGMAVGVEIAIGTEPPISFAATWDLSPSLTMVTSLGVAFGRGAQTGSLTLQTASYTIGVEIRYNVPFGMPAVRSYLGLGAYMQMASGDVSVLVSSSAGVQILMLPNVYLFGEGAAIVPVLDVSGWYWRLKLGIGFRLLF